MCVSRVHLMDVLLKMMKSAWTFICQSFPRSRAYAQQSSKSIERPHITLYRINTTSYTHTKYEIMQNEAGGEQIFLFGRRSSPNSVEK